MTHLVLDIETVADVELFDPPEPAPGEERPFPPLYASKIVVLGALWLDDALGLRAISTLEGGEAAMLAELSDAMTRERPRLVSWNGRGFDLPVLTLRALRHAVPLPWYFEDPDYRDRKTGVMHVDLCDLLSNHGAGRMTSLDGAARLIGLPGKQDGMDGSQVEALYRAGELEALRRYCLSDVAQTAFLLLRYQLLAGKLDRGAYQRAAAALLEALAADGRVARMVGAVDRARLLLA